MIILVVIMFDLTAKLDDFINHKVPLYKIIFNYYLNYIPYFVNLFGYLFFFIAVVFVTSKLASRTEIIAILNGGVSFWRLLQPFLLTALAVALFNLWLTNFALPNVNKARLEFEKVYYRNPYRNTLQNIHIQKQKGDCVYVQRFDNTRNTGYKFTEEFFENNTIVRKVYADIIVYDSLTGKWKMQNWIDRTFNGKYETMERGMEKDWNLGMTPKEFNIQKIMPEELNYRTLRQRITIEKERGSTLVRTLEVEKWQRMINPLAYIVLTVIGVAISCRKTRGGTGLHLAFGIALAFAFIMIMKITTAMAIQSTLHPALSVGIPVVIFAVLSLFLVKKTPK
jgi:lipopolysaccharide export system permease protein